jgi:hypothetical protein
MKKILIVSALMLMSGSAFAQGSTGANHETNNNPGTPKAGMTSGTTSGTSGASMQKEGMSKDGMKKDGMKNDSMSQGGASKDGQGQMNKGGMSK